MEQVIKVTYSQEQLDTAIRHYIGEISRLQNLIVEGKLIQLNLRQTIQSQKKQIEELSKPKEQSKKNK